MVREDDRQKKIDKELKKTYDYKVKRKERNIKGMEIVGEKIILRPRYPEPEVSEIPEPTFNELKEEKKEKDAKSKPEKPKKGEKDKKGKKKDKSSKTSKKSKGGKKSKKSKEVPLILPKFPVCSERERIKVDITGKMADLIKEFKIFNEMLENRHIMLDPHNIDNIPECKNELIFIPSILYFEFTNDGSKTCKLIIRKIPTYECEDTEYFQNEDDAHKVAEEIVESLFNNIFNYFQLESTFLILQPYEYVNVNVALKNTEYAGIYFGKYCVDVYEENDCEQHVGSQELFFHAEITGHFIVVAPELLDFGVCSTESVYQLSLDIFNRSPATHSLSIRFPSTVSSYISTDVSNIYISGDSRRTIWVKLFPRRDIFEQPPSYFDSENNILEFPIRIYVVSKNYFNAPPVQATVYAVLVNHHNLTIIPMSEHLTVYQPNEAVLNLGECSLFETVTTEFMIQNDTVQPQIYGFFNVPQSVTILPNYGFGELQVGESRVLQLLYHPDENDVVKYQNGKQVVEYQKNIILKLDTINNMKILKKVWQK
nr:unnamed protein product [Callosobruchus analis]